MTPDDNNVILLRRNDEPLPTTADQLCPGPCDDDSPCFCALGLHLVDEGIRTIQEKYPALTEEKAALLIGEHLAGSAAIVARVSGNADVAREFAKALIKIAANVTFDSCCAGNADLNVRFRAEAATVKVLESVLCEHVRDQHRFRRLRDGA